MDKKKNRNKGWGFDAHSIDRAVRPEDDFYHFANGGWLSKNKIPLTESRWGSFNILRFNTERQLHALLSSLLKGRPLKSSPAQLVSDFYRSSLDMKRRNALGLTPLEPLRKRIRSISSHKELLECVAYLHRIDISPLWGTYLDQDSKDSSRYLLHLSQGGLGLPEREYYLKSGPEQKRVRDAYRIHIRKLFILSGVPNRAAEEMGKMVLELETKLARTSMRKEDTRDVEKVYNLRTLTRFSSEAPEFDWREYFSLLGIQKLNELVVAQPLFFKNTARLLSSVPLEKWKVYLEWHLLSDAAPLLSEKFVREMFSFYGKTLSGTKKIKPLWRRALSAVNGNLGNALGKLYIKRYFPQEAKQRMDRLVDDLFDAYEKRIHELDWMSPSTKKKAVKKLRSMNRKIGYPLRWKKYAGLDIRPDDYFGNMLRISRFEHRRFLKKLKKPVDRHEWFMSPQTVNAYCHFNLNDIVFPAAILQPPFFSMHGDDGVNYGAIGSVIGHEMTHGFDDQGSKFDHKGNMKSWWTKKDRSSFEKKTKSLIKQFDSFKVAQGISVNGQLTLGENIADLGGLVIAFDAYQERLKKTGRTNIEGFTPEERFFFGFAQAEQELVREEFEKMAALTDPHSPGKYRVNGPLSHHTPFYETFDVEPKDKLYRALGDRVRIW